MPKRKRDEYTKWTNDAPITDVYMALALLKPTQVGRTMTKPYLSIKTDSPQLHSYWYHEADSGGDTDGIDYYELDPKVGAELIEQRLVLPDVKKFNGGSSIQRDRLVLSGTGRTRLQEHIDERREFARSLLVPGEHSKFSGIFNPDGVEWEGLYSGTGTLRFDFKTPMNERVSVWPASEKISKQAA